MEKEVFEEVDQEVSCKKVRPEVQEDVLPEKRHADKKSHHPVNKKLA